VAKSQSKQLVKLARKRHAERSLYEFGKQAWHVVEPGKHFVGGWHIEAICEHLQAVDKGELRRLVITVPLRSSKSLFASVMWPTWTWIRRPEFQWLSVTHSDKLATRDTRKMRNLVQSAWYQERWPVGFARDENLKGSFLNDRGGYRIGMSIGAGVTGWGGDVIILDDPMDRDQAWSKVKRDFVLDEYREKISTRLNDVRTGAIVAIGQRLHESDLLGYLIDSSFDVLCVPMRHEKVHPVKTTTGWQDPRTEDGELMCPERFPEAEVVEMELTLRAVGTAGQLQQRPSAAGGSIFEAKHFRYFHRCEIEDQPGFRFDEDGAERTVPAADCVWFQAVDTALKVSDDAAYTVCVTLAATPHPVRMLVVDVLRERLSVPEQYPALRAQIAKHPLVGFQAVEEAASGYGLIQQAVIDGHPILPLKPHGSKETRASTVAMLYGQGAVYHLAGAPFLAVLEAELLAFPTGQFKDQVDSMAWAGIVLQSTKVRGLLQGRELVTWPAKRDPDETPEERERAGRLAEELTGRRAGRQIRPWDGDEFGQEW
jgi:predicted phage terminase large subunit-like protein